MEYKDYYKVLGVEKTATLDDIKKHYRRLARQYHPDVSTEKNAEEKFKEVREAYEVLKDPKKRAAYDHMGTQWQQGQAFKASPEWDFQSQSSAPFEAGEFSDFFESLFGGRARAHGRGQAGFSQDRRGSDQHSKIGLLLEEAFSGTERTLQLQEAAMDPKTGQVEQKIRSIKVKIPAGVTEGQQIRLAHQGAAGLGQAQRGDLYLEVQFSPHPFYTARDRDIYLHLPVTPWEAALGAKVEVPTLGGKVDLSIPAHSQTGTKLRLKGRGLPGPTPGDQYVLLAIYIQEPKTEKQRELYQKMAEEMHENPRQHLLK